MMDVHFHNNFDITSITDIGKVRAQNQDACANFSSINGEVCIVCDGMGGHAGGQEASNLAIESVKAFLTNKFFPNAKDALRKAINYANSEVYQKAKSDSALFGMGTTLVLVLIRDNQFYYAHIGDSRLYKFANNSFIRLTKDHTFVQGLLDKNMISPEEAEVHPRSNELLKALGTEMQIDPDICEKPIILIPGETLLLCSDGLTSLVDDYRITDIVFEKNPLLNRAQKLIDLSNSNGGHDNITVTMIEFRPALVTEKYFHHEEFFDKKKYTIFSILLFLLIFTYVSVSHYGARPDNHDQSSNYSEGNKQYLKNNSHDTILVYKVRKKDKIEQISERYNISSDTISRINKLINYELTIGQQLYIPVRAIHIVGSGENLFLISSIYKTNVELLMKANELSRFEITSGQTLIIPLERSEIQ